MARVLISMKEEFLKRIDEIAEKEQRSRSELIREALRIYIRSTTRRNAAGAGPAIIPPASTVSSPSTFASTPVAVPLGSPTTFPPLPTPPFGPTEGPPLSNAH